MDSLTYYMLEISCSPGGARKGDYYIYDTLNEIKHSLATDLYSDLYMAASYGECIFLYVIERNQLMQKIDLLPYIIISIEGIFDIQFEDGDPVTTSLFNLPDEDHSEVLSNLTCFLDIIEHTVSDDFSNVKVQASLRFNDDIPKSLRKDQYTIYIDIEWPDILKIQGNTKNIEEIEVPGIWRGKNNKYSYEFTYGLNHTE